jgi:hypothetical protein
MSWKWIEAEGIDFVSDLEGIEELTRVSEEKREAKGGKEGRSLGQKVSDVFF